MELDPLAHEKELQPTKVCARCGQSKPLTEFHRSPRSKDGRYNKCKACVSKYHKQRYANFSPEKKQQIEAGVKAWRESPKGKAYQKRKNKVRSEESAAARKLRGTYLRPEVYKYGAPTTSLPEHRAWMSMKRRCYTPSAGGYAHYGGIGIKVCDRWLESFEHFLADMGRKPRPQNCSNYEPSTRQGCV